MPIWNVSLPSIFMGRMPPGHHRLGNVMPARAGHSYFLAAAYAIAVGQFRRNFHERPPAQAVRSWDYSSSSS